MGDWSSVSRKEKGAVSTALSSHSDNMLLCASGKILATLIYM